MNKAPSGHGRHTPSGHSTGGGGGAGDMSDSGNHASSSSSNKNLTSKALAQLTDVVAVDLGSGDFSLHFPHAFAHASNSSTAWTRPHRFFSVVHPPKPLSASDSQRVKLDKGRFVGNLWAAQALVRARKGGSEVVIGREEERFGSITGGGSVDRARGYLNVWKRDEWEEDPTKVRFSSVLSSETPGARCLFALVCFSERETDPPSPPFSPPPLGKSRRSGGRDGFDRIPALGGRRHASGQAVDQGPALDGWSDEVRPLPTLSPTPSPLWSSF